MINLPLKLEYILPPLCLVILSSSFATFDLNEYLEFNRELVANGEFWRIFTSQFVHANWPHLGLNCAGILLIWALHAEHTSPARYAFNIAILALWCGLGVWLFCPDIQIYTGLSALLHGVIIWGAVKDVQAGMFSGWLLFAGTWAKVIWEQIAGPSESVSQLIASNVAIDAHFIGAVGGTLLALPIFIKIIKNCE